MAASLRHTVQRQTVRRQTSRRLTDPRACCSRCLTISTYSLWMRVGRDAEPQNYQDIVIGAHSPAWECAPVSGRRKNGREPGAARRSQEHGKPFVYEMGKGSGMPEAEYTDLFDRIARSERGMAFLREHARRAGQTGQTQLRTALKEIRASFKEQADLVKAASHVDVLRRELVGMAGSIEQARREISALRPKEEGNNRLLTATNELDAIVSTTERASFDILASAERLMDVSARMRESGVDQKLCGEVEAEVTNIFTACSFQDLTGQRTSKIINALRYVEQRVNAMIGIWEMSNATETEPVNEPADSRPDSHLLNGPRLDGVSQDDIDAMMATDPVKPPPLGQSDIDNLFD